MKVKVYSVYDTKGEYYGMPLFFLNRNIALRWFNDEVANNQSQYAKHPEDYVLYEIGEYDDHSGMLESCTLVNLGHAVTELLLGKMIEAKNNKQRELELK